MCIPSFPLLGYYEVNDFTGREPVLWPKLFEYRTRLLQYFKTLIRLSHQVER